MKTHHPEKQPYRHRSRCPVLRRLDRAVKATKGIEGVGGFVINYLLAAQDLGAATGIIRHYVGATIPIILDLPMYPQYPLR